LNFSPAHEDRHAFCNGIGHIGPRWTDRPAPSWRVSAQSQHASRLVRCEGRSRTNELGHVPVNSRGRRGAVRDHERSSRAFMPSLPCRETECAGAAQILNRACQQRSKIQARRPRLCCAHLGSRRMKFTDFAGMASASVQPGAHIELRQGRQFGERRTMEHQDSGEGKSPERQHSQNANSPNERSVRALGSSSLASFDRRTGFWLLYFVCAVVSIVERSCRGSVATSCGRFSGLAAASQTGAAGSMRERWLAVVLVGGADCARSSEVGVRSMLCEEAIIIRRRCQSDE